MIRAPPLDIATPGYLTYPLTNDLQLNGGSITTTTGGYAVNTTLPAPGATNDALYANNNYVWTSLPIYEYATLSTSTPGTLSSTASGYVAGAAPTIDAYFSSGILNIVNAEYFLQSSSLPAPTATPGTGTPLTIASPTYYYADAKAPSQPQPSPAWPTARTRSTRKPRTRPGTGARSSPRRRSPSSPRQPRRPCRP